MAKRNAEDAGLEDELINTKKARLKEPTTSFENLFSCLPWDIKRLIFARLKRSDYGCLARTSTVMRDIVWHSNLISSISIPYWPDLETFQNIVSLCKQQPLETLTVTMPFPENSITLGALSKELFENQTRLTHLTVATLGELLPNFLSKLTRLQSLVVRLHNSPMSNDLSEVIPASLSNLTSLAITEPELGQHFKKIDIQDYFYPTHIFLHLTNLYELCLGRPMDQNYDVPNVSNLKHLTSLKLLNVKEMPTTFLPKVAKLPNIVALEINEWQDTLVEEDIRPFTRLKRLKITNQFLDMVSLSFMEALEEVELSNHVDILKCSRLTRAVFHEVQSVNALVAANLPSLQDLTLGAMNLTAKEARSLSKATQLTRFAIATHPESLYELFPVFSCLSNLREVCIKNTKLNQIGEILTSLSDNPNLRVLTIPSLHPRGIYHKEEVKRLAQLTQMRVLNVLGKPVELSKDLKCHVEFWADEPSWSL